MERQKNTFAIASLAGGILILLNIILIAMNGGPIVLSSSTQSIDALLQNSSPFWFRIAFGIRDYSGSTSLAVGAVLATIIIYLAVTLYESARNAQLFSFLIIVLTAVTLLYGGGFIIGSILAFIGAALMYEEPKKFNQTLMGKMLDSMRASSQIFEHFAQESPVREGAIVILFANLLSGIGNGIFAFNVTKITGAANAVVPFQILYTNRLGLDTSIVQTPVILMGLGILKWVILSLVLFLVAVNLFGNKASLASVATLTGFAYAPVALQVFTPFIFASNPYQTQWSLLVFLLTNLWAAVILIAGMKQIMNVSYTKSAATVISCGGIYTLINYLVLTQVNIPNYIRFQIQPAETMLFLTSIAIALPILFMGSKKASS